MSIGAFQNLRTPRLLDQIESSVLQPVDKMYLSILIG